jgi:hypothetical protein
MSDDAPTNSRNEPPPPGSAGEASTSRPPSRGIGRYWPVIKWILFALVAAYVGRHAETLWRDVSNRPDKVLWSWWALAAVMAMVAWTPSVLYWRRLVFRAGYPVSLPALVHAYWAGHLGKYVPGKAVAIAVRCAVLRSEGVPLSVSARTAVQETLVSMTVGLAVLFALFPWLANVSRWALAVTKRFSLVGGAEYLWAAAICLVTVIALYLGKTLSAQVVRRLTNKPAGGESSTVTRMPSGTEPLSAETVPAQGMSFVETAAWCLFLAAGWWVHGLALGLVALAVLGEPLMEVLGHWPVWTAAASAGTTVGFFVLIAPGGLAVREELVVDLTQPLVGGSSAVLIAVLSRLAILAGEVGGLAVTMLWHHLTRLRKSP